ncbi:PilZ domain-containing protein [Sphingomonas humi]
MDKAFRAAGEADEAELTSAEQRRFERHEVRCPVRVRIGNRQYAAWLDNASDGGVKLSTACAIKPAERVILQIPDMPPLKGELRWVAEREAGVAFPLLDGYAPIGDWLKRRSTGS